MDPSTVTIGSLVGPIFVGDRSITCAAVKAPQEVFPMAKDILMPFQCRHQILCAETFGQYPMLAFNGH